MHRYRAYALANSGFLIPVETNILGCNHALCLSLTRQKLFVTQSGRFQNITKKHTLFTMPKDNSLQLAFEPRPNSCNLERGCCSTMSILFLAVLWRFGVSSIKHAEKVIATLTDWANGLVVGLSLYCIICRKEKKGPDQCR